ncbi:hypothetical protein BB561_003264 [Smittium simulii]|uniref:UBC core domain-containing protein n=1 Tax=Smittium simulii TaxID=133385 RepID=A0A2T9YMA2_9FUNG|nr:hypothetical protein BB561_003264 [Smittium simulii]
MNKNSSNGAISQLTVLFLFTFWLLGTSVYIFSRGFLLSRFELPNLSSAKSLPVGNTIDHCLFFQTTEFQNGSEQTLLNATGKWIAPQFDRAIVLIVDALLTDSKNIAFNNKKFSVWYGCVFVHSGLWNNAVFKLKIIFPQEYPYESPKIYFLNKIFHPLVKESDGEFNLKPQFPTWKVYEDYLFLALAFLKDSFNNYLLSTLTLDDCFNTEAYSLYRNDLTKFAEIAQSNVRDSLTPSTLYRSESSDCPIVFSHLSDSEHESIKKKIHESVQKSSLHIKKQYRDL